MTVALGLDIGGSKTKALCCTGTVTVHESVAGSANVASVGLAEASRQLDAVLAEMPCEAIESVCAGTAGTPQTARQITDLLQRRFPHAKLLVVHDSQLILAAAGAEDGIALIAGTGSVAWGKRGERTVRVGGWGHLLGDEGSAYWVGQQAVRHALSRVDHGLAADSLTRAITAACGLADPAALLDHFYELHDRRYWAQRASVVFDQARGGDEVGRRIVTAAAAALTGLTAEVGRQLGIDGPVVLAGGLAVHQPMLQEEIRKFLSRNDVRVLDVEPVHGAIRLAQREMSCPS
ncbi:ATPase [Skermania sp. ID1734]|uniref:N-acetylglucosamine kinase n=1 Tax=Skermania sp. ID1734 TaxID=2597516 RepID=UPI00117C1ADF|nr:BadF/BadG/BcrA/BcrD ATPase family protein [Skermania sp. ID1734]TSD95081.1 ATPase [Skermania sp. ID1734]